MNEETITLCNSADLQNGGKAVPFDVNFAGQTCTAFAIRFQGAVHAYLNRCTHVAMGSRGSFLTTRDNGCFAPRMARPTNPIPANAAVARAGAVW
jgi:nitrite reductase/ring-hydroxylating ferredoxin subunit